jgi:Phosphate-selective porin O and P
MEMKMLSKQVFALALGLVVIGTSARAQEPVTPGGATLAAALPEQDDRAAGRDTTFVVDPDSTTATAPEKETTSAAIQVGAGSVEFSGLVQAWYQSGTEADVGTFRLRRAEMKFSGELDPRVEWVVNVDPAKALKINNTYATVGETTVVSDGKVSQSSLMLQDAYMGFQFGHLKLTAGQFKLPLSLEGSVQSSAKIETVERAMFINNGKYGLVRDLGAMVSGSAGPVGFQIGAFNGLGEHQNSVDADAEKPIVGRVVVTPSSQLQFGLSTAVGGALSEDALTRDRLGVEGKFVGGPLTVRAEWMQGRDGLTTREGYYALGAYRIAPSLEVAARFDVWDANTALESSAPDARRRDLVASLSYFLAGQNAKLQSSLIRREHGLDLPAENLIQVNFQTSW